MPAWLKTVGPVAALVVFGLLCAFTGQQAERDSWRAKWAERDAKDLRQLQTRQAENNLSEAKAAKDAAAVEAAYLKEKQNAKNAADQTINDLRNGNRRLLQRFACLRSSGVSEVSPSASIRDGATRCGLTGDDAEFLIRFSEERDDIARQLATAQKQIKLYYLQINGEEMK